MASATQGLSSSKTKAAHSDWREIVKSRLAGSYRTIPPSSSTVAAEEGLGFTPSAYWFLARVENLYGRVLMVWSADGGVAPNAVMSPFDTGGLWHDHVVANPPFADTKDKLEYVGLYTVEPICGQSTFNDWTAEAFAVPYEYVAGVGEPDFVLHHRVPFSFGANSAMAWSWELRVPVDELPADSLRLDRVYWEETDYLQFRSYLRTVLPDSQFDVFLTLLISVSHVYTTLARATQHARAYVASLC